MRTSRLHQALLFCGVFTIACDAGTNEDALTTLDDDIGSESSGADEHEDFEADREGEPEAPSEAAVPPEAVPPSDVTPPDIDEPEVGEPGDSAGGPVIDVPAEPEPPTAEPPSVEEPASSRMRIGTNFTYMAPGWSKELPWREDLPEAPWTNGVDPWNPVFLDDIAMYEVFRGMQWNAVNPLKDNGTPIITDWSQRRPPDDAANFSDAGIGTSQGPGLAYEWQIDLANRMGADLWLNVPIRVNDAFFEELARLVHEQLDPNLRVYVELANEVWNYQAEQTYAKEQGRALGLVPANGDANDFNVALLWQARRSSEMWAAFERVWGEDSDRVVNVLAGWSTNSWVTQNLHLGPLLDEPGWNPTSAQPEAYAIAPYFGGNGLSGDDPAIFDLLRTDIFEHRWNDAAVSGRLKNVRDQYAIVTETYGLELVAYEGGQHIEGAAFAPNHDRRMYDVYSEYLEALAPYFTLFVHYTSTADNTDTRSFGAKDYTGQPAAECPKYEALRDWIHGA